MKKKILCFVDWYLPGYKAGGPIRSISNFVENFGEEFDIYIFCQDRDLSDKYHYSNVNIDNWNKVGKANVFYASRKNLGIRGLFQMLNKTQYDILHLNSFFSPRFTILPLLIRKFFLSSKIPCIISPKGNFSPEALKLKSLKKKIYIKLFKLLNLKKDLTWMASSEHEKKDIIHSIGNIIDKVFVVPDLAPLLKVAKDNEVKSRLVGPLRILFFSRISPIKNLDFLLRVLGKVSFPIHFSIYGPKEDIKYWKQCKKLINKIPSSININIGDAVSQSELPSIFKEHDLFISPTKGEAFGNAIIECLSAGLPGLISDKTLWKTDKGGGLEVLKLEESIWIEKIIQWAKYEDKVLKLKRQAAIKYAKEFYEDKSIQKKNRELFNFILK